MIHRQKLRHRRFARLVGVSRFPDLFPFLRGHRQNDRIAFAGLRSLLVAHFDRGRCKVRGISRRGFDAVENLLKGNIEYDVLVFGTQRFGRMNPDLTVFVYGQIVCVILSLVINEGIADLLRQLIPGLRLQRDLLAAARIADLGAAAFTRLQVIERRQELNLHENVRRFIVHVARRNEFDETGAGFFVHAVHLQLTLLRLSVLVGIGVGHLVRQAVLVIRGQVQGVPGAVIAAAVRRADLESVLFVSYLPYIARCLRRGLVLILLHGGHGLGVI